MSKVCAVCLKEKVDIQVRQRGGRIVEAVCGQCVDDMRETVWIHQVVLSERIYLPYQLDSLRSRKKGARP